MYSSALISATVTKSIVYCLRLNLTRSCIWRQSRTLTARSRRPPISFRRTSSAPTPCWRLRVSIGWRWTIHARPVFGFTTSRLMKFTETWKVRKTYSLKLHPISQARLTRPARPVPITWSVPGAALTVCQP
ncbi:hypothetical protein D3C75_310220 [compost metagenome]